MISIKRLLGWAAGSLLCVTFNVGAPADDSGVPDIGATDQNAQRLLAARCTVCHSIELIAQQRLDREHWSAIVKKMSTWGAQVSESEQETLVVYLASRYHPDADPVLTDDLSPTFFPSIDAAYGNAKRGQGLYAQHCLPCHGTQDAGRMGPQACRQSGFDRCAALLGHGLERAWRPAALGSDIGRAGDRGYSQLASNVEVIR